MVTHPGHIVFLMPTTPLETVLGFFPIVLYVSSNPIAFNAQLLLSKAILFNLGYIGSVVIIFLFHAISSSP